MSLTRRVQYRNIFFFLILIYSTVTVSQSPVRYFDIADFDANEYIDYTINKKIPNGIRAQVLTALSYYPELKHTKIIFRLRKKTTPLTSRPRITGVLRGKKGRAYVITISTASNEKLSPILFSHLPYNAQVGVIGHELAHIAEYNTKSSGQIIGLSFKLLKSKHVDIFEFNTDRRSIEHGLGHQLYDWSVFVRKALNIEQWNGAPGGKPANGEVSENQRYMNPETVLKYIQTYDIYNTVQ